MPRKKTAKKEPPKSLKGMRDIMDPEYSAYQGFFEKASEIAQYYGFKPIELPILEKEELYQTSIGEGTDILDKELYSLKTKSGYHLAMRPEGTSGIMRAYIEQGMHVLPQPVMLYYYGSFFRHEKPQNGKLREFKQFGLEILGTTKSVADATIIKVFLTILEEAGFKNLRVKINSIGDEDSRKVYLKELVAYYKKQLEDVCPDCRQRIKTNPIRLLDCSNEKCQSIKEEAPDAISSLNTQSKKHFKEVLEYLDAMEVTYEINNELVRGINYYTQTVFEIVDVTESDKKKEEIKARLAKEVEKEKEIVKEAKKTESKETNETKEEVKKTKEIEEINPLELAGGGRYDLLAKKLKNKKEVPSVGASMGVDKIINSNSHKTISPRIKRKARIFFIQLGFEAKLKSLTVVEILRKARIPIMHSLAKDRLSAQLAVAEKLKIPYTIILGQREALDNTVIVRNMKTRSQETMKVENLPDYIKKLK